MILLVFMIRFLHLPGNNGEKRIGHSTKTLYKCWFHYSKSFFSSAGASHPKGVFQTPPSIIKELGQSVVGKEISCSHNMPNYDVFLWYKREKERGDLKLLGFLNVDYPNPEDDVKGKIDLKGDARDIATLTISDLVLNDTGVYFCAASQHSAADSSYFNTKTPLCLPARQSARCISLTPADI